jgi:Domain of unknown function (DUF397)
MTATIPALRRGWQKSSFSGDSSNCLEIGWQTSSYGVEADNCLDVTTSPGDGLHLRESVDPTTVLVTTPARLAGLLDAIKADHIT